MKKYLILIAIFTTSLFAYQSFAQDQIAGETITSFFNALKSGDTAKLLQHIDGPLYKRNKELLNRNNNYADLLKTKYENVEFLIDKMSYINHEKIVADILFVSPDGHTVNRKLILHKKEGSDSWKIINEIRSGL